MPANQGRGPENWHPQADFTQNYHVNPVINEVAINFNDEAAVAAQLRFTDATVASYEFMLSEPDLQQLALESARALINRRQSVYQNGKTAGLPCEPYTPKRRFG